MNGVAGKKINEKKWMKKEAEDRRQLSRTSTISKLNFWSKYFVCNKRQVEWLRNVGLIVSESHTKTNCSRPEVLSYFGIHTPYNELRSISMMASNRAKLAAKWLAYRQWNCKARQYQCPNNGGFYRVRVTCILTSESTIDRIVCRATRTVRNRAVVLLFDLVYWVHWNSFYTYVIPCSHRHNEPCTPWNVVSRNEMI